MLIRVESLPEFVESGENMARKRNRKTASLRHNTVIAILLVVVAVLAFVNNPNRVYQWLGLDFLSSSSENNSSLPQSAPSLSDNEDFMEVHFLDVGQGDSQLIKIFTPNTPKKYFTILIDAGEYRHADDVIAYLQNQNIQMLNVVVATHPHADHIGAMSKIIQNFDIGTFYMPVLEDDQTPTTKSYEAMLDALLDRNVHVEDIHAGTYIDTPIGSKIEVLSPKKKERYENINNYSAVMRLTYGENSFLFTGDAEKEVENDILDQYFDIQSQVLACGHHGSSSSTTENFLEAVAPTYAVISSEKGNSYGHPHKETLATLNRSEVEILRTDTLQTIVITSDGKNLTVRTHQPSARKTD